MFHDAIASLGASILLALSATTLVANQPFPPAPDVVMRTTHKPRFGLRDVIAAEAAKPNPDHKMMEQAAAEFTKLLANLELYEPPRGDRNSWVRLSREYHQLAQKLEEAVKKKDTPGVIAVIKTQGKKCDTCHESHRIVTRHD